VKKEVIAKRTHVPFYRKGLAVAITLNVTAGTRKGILEYSGLTLSHAIVIDIKCMYIYWHVDCNCRSPISFPVDLSAVLT